MKRELRDSLELSPPIVTSIRGGGQVARLWRSMIARIDRIKAPSFPFEERSRMWKSEFGSGLGSSQ